MTQLLQVSVENELDLTLAYKKSIKAAELLGLSLSTQTAFATAVSEVCREIIDKTHDGLVIVQVHTEKDRFFLVAEIMYTEVPDTGSLQEGLLYAQKLVPVFEHRVSGGKGNIMLKLSVPRASKPSLTKVSDIKRYFDHVEPISPYEEVRKRNMELFQINEQSSLALKHAEYLIERKNEFLSIASHELKTPLTILRAFTQLALRADCSPEVLVHLKKVDVQAVKVQTMILQLFDIARTENNRSDYLLEVVDFNGYMEEISDLLHHLVPNHKLLIELGTSALVNLDKLRIEQVINNIIGNAAKYSSSGSTITLSTSIVDQHLVIAIKDQGMGMNAAELDKIFEKFYRVDGSSKSVNGLGMGLYISARIIADHDGSLSVESEPNQGSVFYIKLKTS